MNSIFAVILAISSSYLIGSIPTSFLMAKLVKGVDIRSVGSGNVGATNVVRTVGKLPGLVTLIIDILKGVFVVTVIANLFYPAIKNLDYGIYRSILGLAVICGHIWTIFLKFRGGKGVATTIGVMAVIAPAVLLASIFAWLLVFFLTNYVSLASIVLGVSFPVTAAIMNKPIHIVIFCVIICILISYKHKDNVRRLMRWEEHKTGLFKKC